MKRRLQTGVGTAGVIALSMVALVQTSPQQPATPQTSTAAAQPSSSAQRLTVTGCVQKEADYRKANDAGQGGAAGTGVGVGNEFVLINATTAPAPGTPPSATGTPTGTAGTTDGASAYELTGSNESQAERFVGKRVEIVGTLKPAKVDASGSPTGGPTAGAPPRGVDVISKDLKLGELEISSMRETTGSCPQ